MPLAIVLAVALLPHRIAAGEGAPVETAMPQQEAAALLPSDQDTAAETELKRSLARLEAQFGPGDPRLADPLSELGSAYEAQGRYQEAEALYRRILRLRERAPGPEHLDLGASLNDLARLYKLQGRFGEALELFRRALEIVEAAAAPPVPVLVTILNNLGLVYQSQGRYDEAEPLYRRALVAAAKAPQVERALAPVVLNNLAGLYKEQRRFAEAEPLYRRVLESREKGAAPLDLAAALNNLAALYDEQGRHREAEPLYRRSLALREQALGPMHPEVAQSLNNLAGIYWAEGDYRKVEPLLRRALDIREQSVGADHPDTATALNNLAALYWNEQRYDDALSMSRRAVRTISEHLAANAGQDSDAVFAESRKSQTYIANYVGIAYGAALHQPERQAELAADSFQVMQLAERSSTAQAVAGMAARFAAANDALAAAIRKRQDLALRRQRLEAEIVKAALRPPGASADNQASRLRTDLAETTKSLALLDRNIRTEFPRYVELTNPEPASAAAIQTLLGPDEALLVYFATQKDTWLWVVRRDRLALFRADWNAPAIAREVAVLRSAMTPNFAPFPAIRAFELYAKILAPAAPLLAGTHHLIVVPDGALQSLPFGMLVGIRPERDPIDLPDYRSLAWLSRDYAISVLPAVSALRAFRQADARRAAPAPFLGIGDPELSEGSMAASSPAPAAGPASRFAAALRNLPPLPDSAAELREIGQTLGASEDDLLLGRKASEAELRRIALDRYRVIEFATHALLAGEIKGLIEPALVLTPPPTPIPENDGLLTASKIATLRLNADWVVLSACNTGTGESTAETGGWSALAEAFFYAGTRSLLISHWPVWSKAALTLTTGTFRELARHPEIGRAEALRRAQLAMLDPTAPLEFAHPMAWAPFALAGEGGVGR